MAPTLVTNCSHRKSVCRTALILARQFASSLASSHYIASYPCRAQSFPSGKGAPIIARPS